MVDSTTSCPTPSPTATVTPSNTPSVSITPTTTPSISITRTPSTTPPVSGTPSPTPSLSVSNTPSISISATPTPSPSTSDALDALYMDMANNSYDACHAPETFIVVYDQSPLQTNDWLYKSSAGTSKYTFAELQDQLAGTPFPIYLSDGSNVYEINQDGVGNAQVASVAACVPATPPASVTPSTSPPISATPSVTPSKSFITPSTSAAPAPSVSATPSWSPTPPASVTPSVSTTPPNSPLYCTPVDLGDGATFQDACANADTPTTRYLDAGFIGATVMYRYSDCTGSAPAGYYSDGNDWRYWDGSSFTTSGECGIY